MEENQETKTGMFRQSSSLWMGLIFIIGGIFLLLNQLDIIPFELNWWALFILMPASGFLSGAYNRFRSQNNQLSTDVMFQGLIGLFLVFLSISLLVGAAWNINWNLFWPIILILVGLGMLLGRDQKE